MPSQPLVIVAVSGRALAESAARQHGAIVILDAFADADTRRAGHAVNVGLRAGIGIDTKRMLAALAKIGDGTGASIVTGSGFERMPDLLDRIETHGRLYANDSTIVRALKDPDIFPELLRAQGWTVPDTQRAVPADRAAWLQKRIGGAAGIHIHRASGRRHGIDRYYQREVTGTPMSVTFLADGERAHVLGCNRLLTQAMGALPWCHAGIVSGVSLAPALRASVQTRLDRLVRVTGLRGLNGVDFLLAGDDAVALEINPRPTASFELYDPDYEEGLVHWHMASFEGPLRGFERRSGQTSSRALRIVYADRDTVTPDDAVWPAWGRDLPMPGTRIPAGAPVLTVVADGPTMEAALAELDRRRAAIARTVASWTSRGVALAIGAAP
ncbi:MAG: ATP-grasp domain-containing protein [Burkholderiales bacterium]|nr:ATP-grasp domain-containing protein [Burkholderiales bacterium]